MAQLSDDGFWELVDGDWVPTDKQEKAISGGAVLSQSPPGADGEEQGFLQENVQFVPQRVTQTEKEVIVNESAKEGYIQLSPLTTTTTHTSAAKEYLGNPFYLNRPSKWLFDGIQDPGALKLKNKILGLHSVVEFNAKNNFNSGDMSHGADEIIASMYGENEAIISDIPLKIRKVELLAPTNESPNGFRVISEGDHYGVRGVLTNERILLIDSTEDSVSKLTNPVNEYVVEPLQRKQSGVFEISHKIMHDFWFKSISLDDVTGTEFHFSHYSQSSKVLKRYHHSASIIALLFGLLSFGLSFIDQSFSEGFLITNIFTVILLISSWLIYYYASQMKDFITTSSHGKERNLKIGYYDQIHNRQMVLNFELEDSQKLDGTIEWINTLEMHYKSKSKGV